MELTHYLRLILRHWLSFAVGVIVTVAVGAALILSRPDIFESKGTYVVRPTSVDSSDVVRAFDTLIRGVEINATYVAIARSDIIRDRAKASLASGPDVDTRGLDVDASVVTGTNIISISVRGEDPEAAAIYAEQIGQETVRYVNDLRDVFQLEQLDPPTAPRSPVGPNRRLDLAITIILGLGVGTALAIGIEALSPRTSPFPQLNVIDTKTGLYNDAYFKLRVEEESARAGVFGEPLSFGMIRVARGDPWESDQPLSDSEELRGVSSALGIAGVVAYVGDGTLAVIMPEVDLRRARELAAGWADSASLRLNRNGTKHFDVGSGACEYRNKRFTGDRQVQQVIDRIVDGDREARPGATTAVTA
ncbi:MAG: hypothetical protein OEV40_02205 [Acidimicrobiia bacterium]|nr:hypothetical protein [Acidimicrobiia bacterium]